MSDKAVTSVGLSMPNLPIGVVVNNSSGKGRGRLVASEAWRALAQVPTVDLSADTFDQALAQAKAAVAAGQISALAVVGGDGMVHLGVNACANTDVPLMIIPAGTGNDSATVLGIPTDDTAAAVAMGLAAMEKPRRFDLISGNTAERQFYSFGTVSAGFDALVNAKANRMSWPKGPSRYQVAMVLELLRFKGLRYKAEIDGKPRDIEAMLCAVANIHSFGGGMMIAPHAKPDDGQLDLFIVHRITRATLLKIFPKVYTGGHVTHPAVEFVSAKKVVLDNGAMPVYSDGEYVGTSPVTVEVLAGALKVCAL